MVLVRFWLRRSGEERAERLIGTSEPPHYMISSLLGEYADDTGRALGFPLQRLDELVPREPGLERVRLEVGGDQREGVVMRRARRRARAEVVRQTHQALAADVFVRLLAGLAFRE